MDRRIVWQCLDKDALFLSLAKTGGMLTYAGGTDAFVSPLALLSNVNEWAGRPVIPQDLMKRAKERIGAVYDTVEKSRDPERHESMMKQVNQSAEDDFAMVREIIEKSDILPCLFVVEYDNNAPNGKRIKAAIQVEDEPLPWSDDVMRPGDATIELDVLTWLEAPNAFITTTALDLVSGKSNWAIGRLLAIWKILEDKVLPENLSDEQCDEALALFRGIDRIFKHVAFKDREQK